MFDAVDGRVEVAAPFLQLLEFRRKPLSGGTGRVRFEEFADFFQREAPSLKQHDRRKALEDLGIVLASKPIAPDRIEKAGPFP
ncbi:MAG: hypothetical protein OEX04_16175, partial [Acidimicrobiia bacterium]|nr:hypothetical protein [Acidimicrobiia bacterium]